MMSAADRYGRQARLSEVGASGQAALGRATIRIGCRHDAMTELSYLERAGIGAVSTDVRATAVEFAHAKHFRHQRSRAYAAGAWRALRHIDDVLERLR